MLKLFEIEGGTIRETDPDAVPGRVSQADWIDAQDPDEGERKLLESLLHTDIPAIDEVEEIEASARCFVDKGVIHVRTMFLSQSEGRNSTVSVACILQNQRLITIREGELADFRLLRLRARRGQVECRDAVELLITLFEQKVENHADHIEDIHRQLEAVSYLVLEDETAELEEGISRLARLEDSNGKIRLCLMDTHRGISFLTRHLRNRQEVTETLRDIVRDIETLMSHTAFLFDKINFLMDSTQGFINIEQNQIIKIFSIAAVVFLPPTLIASIYGMNFRLMPELAWPWGYPLAVCLMIASAIAPYWFFKRKGWL